MQQSFETPIEPAELPNMSDTYKFLYQEAKIKLAKLEEENQNLLEDLEFASNRIALLEANNEIGLK